MPAGATEQDAVLSIAKAVWRKRRAQKFLETKLLKNMLIRVTPLMMKRSTCAGSRCS